jgi:hypothetical protein
MANIVRRGPKTSLKAKFNEATFKELAQDLQSGRIPLDRVQISDNDVSGLRAIIRNTGTITYHVNYMIHTNGAGSRTYIKIGDYPDINLTTARKRAQAVIALGKKGVDVQEALHDRLMREIDRDGESWRPGLAPPPGRNK